jgi:hypothetical protein
LEFANPVVDHGLSLQGGLFQFSDRRKGVNHERSLSPLSKCGEIIVRGEDLIFLLDDRRHSDWSIYNRRRF